MALETGTYISDLVSTNPAASDNISQGDDHIRLLKSTLKATFPNITGAVTATHTDLNKLTSTGSPTFNSVLLTDTDAGAGAAPLLELRRDSASPAANDAIGTLLFSGEDSLGNLQEYARIDTLIASPTSAAEGGELRVRVVSNGTMTEALKIDSSGRVLVGTSSYLNGFNTSQNLVLAGSTNPGINIFQGAASTAPGVITFNKSRGTPGSTTVVSSGDTIGTLNWGAADGTSASVTAARITAEVDGTPGTSDMPGRLVLSTTADGASTPTERLRIANNGAWGLAGANYGSSGQVLTSNGSSSAPTWGNAPTSASYTSYTSGSGTWTIPSSGTYALVRAWGGGGSGPSIRGSSYAASGGGGGACVERLYRLSDLGSAGSTVSYSVAAGGAAVTNSTNGNFGGATTFGSGSTLLTAYGGGRGVAAYSNYADGGGGAGMLGYGGSGGTSGGGGVPGLMGGGDGSFQRAANLNSTNATLPEGGGAGGAINAGTFYAGGKAYFGGGGGGPAMNGSGVSGGTSVFGGSGGDGGGSSGVAATSGTSPAGGGGAWSGISSATFAASGAGANGRIEIFVW